MGQAVVFHVAMFDAAAAVAWKYDMTFMVDRSQAGHQPCTASRYVGRAWDELHP